MASLRSAAVPCKYWRPHEGGGCRDGGACPHAHAAPAQHACRFHAAGRCEAGARCRYLHGAPRPASAVLRRGRAPPSVPRAEAEAQRGYGAQSLRGVPGADGRFGGTFGGEAHPTQVFQRLCDREGKLAGEWAVFYHSYNSPALVYEVQAAVAKVLFRFGAEYGALPRLLKAPYEALPDAAAVLKAFPSWRDQDHNPLFKGVGICCSTSLLSADPEATPTDCFLQGYAASHVTLAVLTKLLTDCGAGRGGASSVNSLAEQVVQLAKKHGLPQATGTGHPGHLLQIFIHRSQVDRYAYASMPGGVPDPRRQPLSGHMAGPGPICGQARVITNPSAFMRASSVRLYVASAHEAFHSSRGAFQAELCGLLAPILGEPAARREAAQGVYNGRLPSWWGDLAAAAE